MGTKKLLLDLTFGAAIPLAILSYGNDYLGARLTFVLAGLIPAIYVLWDIFFYSKKFNFITTVIAITALTQGGASLLTVSGWQYALADTAGTIVTFIIFGVSLLMGRPIVNYFVVQVFEPQSPDEEQTLRTMLAEPTVHRQMILATIVLLAENALRGIGCFLLAWSRVVSPFGTEQFNFEKRNVDAITRIGAPILMLGTLVLAFWIVNRAIDTWIGDAAEDGGTLFEQIRRRLAKDAKPAETPVTA